MPRTKRRECVGKKRHDTKVSALEQIAQRQLHFGAAPGEYRAYHCPHCGRWHVGHRGTRDRKEGA